MEASEDIIVHVLDLNDDLLKNIKQLTHDFNYSIGSKLWYFALGWKSSSKFKNDWSIITEYIDKLL